MDKLPDVINFYTKIKTKDPYYNPNKYTPQHPHRTIIVGSSGSMKTNTLLNIIKTSNAYTKIYLFAKALDEPLYEYLHEKLKGIESIDGTPILYSSDTLNDVPDVKDFDSCQQNLIIFDDMISEGSKKLREKLTDLFIRGRKQNISVIFITQSFYEIPKIIRSQANYYILKNISSKRDKNLIAKDIGVDKDEIINAFDHVQNQDRTSFLMVDLKTVNPNMRYRINFKPFI